VICGKPSPARTLTRPVGFFPSHELTLPPVRNLSYAHREARWRWLAQLLELPRQHCPEVLLCALASCGAEWGVLQEEVAGTLLLPYLGNHPNAAVVLRRLWVSNPKCVLLGMVELHAKEPACVARLLDVCQELQVSNRKFHVTSSSQCPFTCLYLRGACLGTTSLLSQESST
jgi:hypothetical protein